MHKNIGTIYRYLPPSLWCYIIAAGNISILSEVWKFFAWLSIFQIISLRGGGVRKKLHAAFVYNQHLSMAPRGTSCLPGRLSVSGWLWGCSGLPRCGSPMLTSHSADGLPACFLPPHPGSVGWGGWSLFSAAQILECEFAPPCYRGGPHLGQLLHFFCLGDFFLLYFASSYNYYFSEYCFSLPCGFFLGIMIYKFSFC